MFLAEKIQLLFMHINCMTENWEDMTPIARRMYAIGFMNEMHQIITQLEEINEQLDTSLSFEDAYLDYVWNEDTKFKIGRLLDERMYREEPTKDTDINHLIDLFPLSKDDYSFTPEKAGILKTGLRYICSEANIAPRDIVYALDHGIGRVAGLLTSIKNKKANIQDYQYEDFWNDFLVRDDDLYIERAFNDYEKWKEEHDCQDFQTLMDKRTQEILKVLKSGVFTHDVVPVKREIGNSIITIPEDALEEGAEIPENIKVECARISKYVQMKDEILCFDYAKLGKYIYKHYSQLSEEEENSLIYFENILFKIHDDMVVCNPKLKKHLKYYEEEGLKDVLTEAQKIIDSCKYCLLDNAGEDYLTVYMEEAFYGPAKTIVQSKLKGQSKYTIICQMIGMLKSTQRVFKVEITSADLAEALSKVVKKPAKKSLERYINEGSRVKSGKILDFTNEYVTKTMVNEYEGLFLKISHK